MSDGKTQCEEDCSTTSTIEPQSRTELARHRVAIDYALTAGLSGA